MRQFMSSLPNLHTRIAFYFLGVADGEMTALKSKMTQFLKIHGYDNVVEGAGYAIPTEMSESPYFSIQQDRSVIIYIPANH